MGTTTAYKGVNYFKEVPRKGGVGTTFESVPKDLVKKNLKVGQRRKEIRDEILKLESELSTIKKDCKHEVLTDEDGWPYYIRTCVACGEIWLI